MNFILFSFNFVVKNFLNKKIVTCFSENMRISKINKK